MKYSTDYSFCEDPENNRELFLQQLERYRTAGVEITVQNVCMPLEHIADMKAIREGGSYMCDFITDEENRLVRINIDLVRNASYGKKKSRTSS